MKNQPIWQRFLYSLAGLKEALRTERSFRADSIVFILIVLLLVFLRPQPIWWALLLFASGLLLVVELINTAVEKLIDHLHPQQHAALGIVKDTLSAAVLITCLMAACILTAFFIDNY